MSDELERLKLRQLVQRARSMAPYGADENGRPTALDSAVERLVHLSSYMRAIGREGIGNSYADADAIDTVLHALAAAVSGGRTVSLQNEVERAINRWSAENASNTPDWILAQFLMSCLDAWNTGVQQRETWYGRDAGLTMPGTSDCRDSSDVASGGSE